MYGFRLPCNRERHGLLKPELEQRFAWDQQLLAFFGTGDGCSGHRTGSYADGRSRSSPRNTADERAQPCTADDFLCCF